MKRFKLFAILLAVLSVASIGYAERNSSTAPQTQQNPQTATTTAPSWGWACPMWGWWGQGGGNQVKGSVMPYGPMGPGMMYYYGPVNPAQNQSSGTGSSSSSQQQQPKTDR